MTEAFVGVMEGDGVGPKIIEATLPIIKQAGRASGLTIDLIPIPAAGAAYEQSGEHLPELSVKMAKSMDAVLKGPFGGPPGSTDPKWQGLEKKAILPLREKLGVYANLRPVKILGEVGVHLSPLKNKIAQGTDLMIVRELTGDAYFGESGSGRDEETGERYAFETMHYTESQVRRVIQSAIKVAHQRNDKLTWIHKTNVLEETGALWWDVFEEVTSKENLETGYMHVDASAAAVIGKIKTGTIVTTNLFGDILSDETARITGSLGLGPSASLDHTGFGLFEPIHGSAPDIENTEDANPIGMILSGAMMFRHSLGRSDSADLIERSVADVLDDLYLPSDLYDLTDGEIEGMITKKVTATDFGKYVLKKMEQETA